MTGQGPGSFPRGVDSDPEPAGRLVSRVEAARAGLRRYRLTEGLVWTGLALAAALAAAVALDWEFELPWPARTAALAGVATVAAVLAARRVVAPARAVDRADAAAAVEGEFPRLGQRVRTALEYAEPTERTAPAAPGLVAALEDDAERKTRAIPLDRVIPWPRLRVPAASLAIAGLMGLAALVEQPELRVALARALLLPGAYTTLAVKPGDQTVKAGSDFTLEASVAGRPVRFARWLRRPAGGAGAWTAEPLGADASEQGALAGTLAATLNDCQADFEYRVVAGGVESPTYRVKVIHPLAVTSFAADVAPPAYTRKPPSTHREGDLAVIEGSRVAFRVTLDRAPASAVLVVKPSADKGAVETSIPLNVEGATLTGALAAVTDPLDYEVRARAADGMELDPKRHAIRVRRDEKPTLRFVRPPEDLAVIPTAEVPMKVEASDDFGLARVGLVYQVNNGPKETLALDDLKGRPVTAELLVTLYLEKHKLDYTDSLTYYAYAEDNKPFRPNRTSTELRFIDILPYQQAFQKVEGGGT